jgi:hypothetical protein
MSGESGRIEEDAFVAYLKVGHTNVTENVRIVSNLVKVLNF